MELCSIGGLWWGEYGKGVFCLESQCHRCCKCVRNLQARLCVGRLGYRRTVRVE